MNIQRYYVTQEMLDDVVRNAVLQYEKSLEKNKDRNPLFISDISDMELDKFNGYYDDNDFIEKHIKQITEGLIKTYDSHNTIDTIIRKYYIAPNQISIDRRNIDGVNIDLITLIIPRYSLKQPIFEDVVNTFATCGYHVCHKMDHINPNILTVVFEPRYTTNIGKEIKEKYRFLYHATPTIYVNKILQNGLTPHASNDNKENEKALFFYPDRIYLMRGDTLDDNQINVLKNIKNNRSKKPIRDNNEYTILKIDTSKIPDDMDFYADPLVKKGAIFTYNSISPESITVDGILKETIDCAINRAINKNTILKEVKNGITRLSENTLKEIIKDVLIDLTC